MADIDSVNTAGAKGTGPHDVLDRAHSCSQCILIASGLSMCITVDILQYSMPLAFLPSVLEDRGHSSMKIATAIGVYYWTGFLGGLMITCYKIWQVLSGKGAEGKVTIPTARKQITYLIFGLAVGTITLGCQAMSGRYWVHTACRFIQGFSGSFLFFYTFLLSASLFQGQQQVFSMTAASIALNVAEVMGSFIGAILFDSSGEGSVFWFLAGASVLNQVILVAIMSMLKASPEFSPVPPNALADLDPQTRRERGLARLWNLCKSPRLACAIILIFTAALVKGSVEEMLPFHADHQWGYQPLMIGQLFSTIAIAYIISAALCGQVWQYLRNYRVVFSATWLFVLGITGWCVFIIATFNKNESVLFTGLLMYGVCLGLTHTPAALLLADAIEHEEDPNCKEAVNGIWNTMWELGGSVGFLLGGLLADHYREQMQLMAGYAVVCTMSSLLMVSVTKWSMPSGGIFKGNAKPEIAYGAA